MHTEKTKLLPPVGSKWQDHGRTKRTLEVIRYNRENGLVRIHCLETDTLTWAKAERFTGKKKAYSKLG